MEDSVMKETFPCFNKVVTIGSREKVDFLPTVLSSEGEEGTTGDLYYKMSVDLDGKDGVA